MKNTSISSPRYEITNAKIAQATVRVKIAS